MSLRNVLLVYLASGASSGYDIAKGFRGSFGYLWNASHQQIYRDLASLHDNGLLSCETRPQVGKPDRKLYQLTEAGREAMQTFLATPTRPPKYNDAFMVKVASAHLMHDKQPLLDELLALRQKYQRYLEGLEKYQAFFDSLAAALQPQLVFARLSLQRGLQVNRSWLAWSEELEAALRAAIDPATDQSGQAHG
jgi:PadR family transcriptional regulator AphA